MLFLFFSLLFIVLFCLGVPIKSSIYGSDVSRVHLWGQKRCFSVAPFFLLVAIGLPLLLDGCDGISAFLWSCEWLFDRFSICCIFYWFSDRIVLAAVKFYNVVCDKCCGEKSLFIKVFLWLHQFFDKGLFESIDCILFCTRD